MQQRGAGRVRPPGRLGLGGLLGHPLALGGDVEQLAQRLGDALELGDCPTRRRAATYSQIRCWARSRTVISSSPGEGTGSATIRARLAPVAASTILSIAAHWARKLTPGNDRRRRLGEQRRLLLARGGDPRPALGLPGPGAAELGQAADDDRGDQQDDERDQVLACGGCRAHGRGAMKK